MSRIRNRSKCDCGEPATVVKGDAFICERCAKMEANRRELFKRETAPSKLLSDEREVMSLDWFRVTGAARRFI